MGRWCYIAGWALGIAVNLGVAQGSIGALALRRAPEQPEADPAEAVLDVQRLLELELDQAGMCDAWDAAQLGRGSVRYPPAPKETTAAQQNPVRARLHAITETPTKIHAANATTPSPPSPPALPAEHAAPAPISEASHRAQIQDRIKRMEAALAAIPEDHVELSTERASIGTHIAEYKRQLIDGKPIGEEAEQTLSAATALVKHATDEVTTLETELAELERQHVQQIFEGSQATLRQAEATRAAAAGVQPTLAGFSVKTMATASAPPPSVIGPASGSLVRHRGKQKPKELITDYFTRRKVVKSIFKDTSASSAAGRRAVGSMAGFPVPADAPGERADSAAHSCGKDLRITTSNVCTLRPHEEHAAGTQASCQLLCGKVQILEDMFVSENIDVVFLQGGRAVKSEQRKGAHFCTFVGAADEAGGFGCQRERFWDVLLATISTLPRKTPAAKVLLGIDANGRVGHRPSRVGGSSETDAFSPNGFSLPTTLRHLHLSAHNTQFEAGYFATFVV
ncbi:unnamed protein product [Prorocentrum cordatum]|uniref:Endonuclease/exonuclease/phosphatase domain-containing protein n=1 Tax=Prorocentrum cordatum TaxID=2364126 RepID=A0ABN9Y614_9DINO|nr:unnamed protein product [Polarella glacialis]CAK0906474.1 unnamed protein product [Polarella glacialis]